MDRQKLEKKLDQKRKRLEAYRSRELEMLTGGVQSYGIGSRNLTRYNTDLAQIREALDKLETEVAELEGLLDGRRPIKTVAVIPRDW